MFRFFYLRSASVIGAAVFAGLIFLFGGAGPVEAQTVDDHDEFTVPASPIDEERPAPMQDLVTALSLDVGWSLLNNEDMRRTYGGLPWIQVTADFAVTPYSAIFLAAGYGKRGGDPYYDTIGSDADDALELAMLPLSLGIRTDWSRGGRVGVMTGAGFQLVHAWEQAPVADSLTGAVTDQTCTGWLTGVMLTIGPEWRSRDHRRALGLEVGIGGSKGEVTGASHRHDVDLTGIHSRLYYAFKL